MSCLIKVKFVAEKHPDFVSRLIMDKYKTNYSHVLIEYEDNGVPHIFHATGRGVHIMKGCELLKYHHSHNVVSFEDIRLDVSKDFFLGFVKGSSGKEYSQSQIAAIATGGVQENGDEKMICSELVGVVLRDMSPVKIAGKQDGWTPYDIRRALDNHLNL